MCVPAFFQFVMWAAAGSFSLLALSRAGLHVPSPPRVCRGIWAKLRKSKQRSVGFRPWGLSEWGGEEARDEKWGLSGPRFPFVCVCLVVFRGDVLQGGAPVCKPVCEGMLWFPSAVFRLRATAGQGQLGVSPRRAEWLGSVNLAFVLESDARLLDLMSDGGTGYSSTTPTPQGLFPTLWTAEPALRPQHWAERGCDPHRGGRGGCQMGQGSGHRRENPCQLSPFMKGQGLRGRGEARAGGLCVCLCLSCVLRRWPVNQRPFAVDVEARGPKFKSQFWILKLSGLGQMALLLWGSISLNGENTPVIMTFEVRFSLGLWSFWLCL